MSEKPAKEIVEERVYTVPIHKVVKYIKPKGRAKKAVKTLREFISKHMKADVVLINPDVNEKIWEKGIENPPHKIKVRATRDIDGVVEVLLAEV
ncbi:MAG: 50S ribosomal protein L31e [Candidatus Hodarchaeota archaeon]